MNENGAEHLVVVGHFAVVVVARHAVVAMDLLGAEVFDPVQGNQVMAVKEDVVLKDLAALQLTEDGLEEGAKPQWVNVVENLAQLSVAGNGLEAKDRAEVVIQRAATEGEQGRVLEGVQGKASHQGVGQREVRTTAMVGNLIKGLPSQSYQSVKVEVLPLMPQGSSFGHGHASKSTSATVAP
jgi:hypothetical protein